MSELIINATPALPPSGAGNANPLSQGDAVARSGESARTNTESGAASPFASVLKSRMDKKADDADAADSASSISTAAQTDAGTTVSLDISALFPFMETSSDTATGLAAGEAGPDETLAPGLGAAVEPALAQMLLLPSTPAAVQPAGPAASLPASALAQSSAATPPSASAAAMANSRKQNAEANDEAFTSAGPAQTGGTRQTPGKMVPDAAINADAGNASGEQNSLGLPANDFHALLERATALTPVVAGAGNGPSAGTQLRIDTPLGQSGWHDEMGQKLTWMVGNNRQQADLVLNPPQLGRIEVSLTMNGDQATAVFTSANPAVREALENSLHRLREVLADAGVSLGQAQVGSESPHQSSRKDEPDFGMNEGMRYASAIPLPAAQAVAGTSAGRSMIDIFA